MNTLVNYNLLVFFAFTYLAEIPRALINHAAFFALSCLFLMDRGTILQYCLGSKWTDHKTTCDCPLILIDDKNNSQFFRTYYTWSHYDCSHYGKRCKTKIYWERNATYDWHLLEYFSVLLSVLVDKRMPEQCISK